MEHISARSDLSDHKIGTMMHDKHEPKEYIDHKNRLIVVDPAKVTEIDSAWQNKFLYKENWSAGIEPCRAADDGKAYIHGTSKPNLWCISIAGYAVSDQSPIGSNACMTTIIYFDSEAYAKRLAQRALALWIQEVSDKIDRDKTARIATLTRCNKELTDELDRLYQRLQRALEQVRP